MAGGDQVATVIYPAVPDRQIMTLFTQAGISLILKETLPDMR